MAACNQSHHVHVHLLGGTSDDRAEGCSPMTIQFDILLLFRVWAAEIVATVIHEHAHALAALALGQGIGYGRNVMTVLSAGSL